MSKPDAARCQDSTRLPEIKIRQRPSDPQIEAVALKEGLHPVAARVFAARRLPAGTTPEQAINPRLSDIDPPWTLKGIGIAAARLAKAIMDQQVIHCISDFDSDGLSGNSICYSVITGNFGHPVTHFKSWIGHRLQDGYGITDSMVDRILAEPIRPSVLISTDCGSSDEPRIQRLKAEHIDVLVTDHHQVPTEGPPASAYACINPNQPGCGYVDGTIAGCMVTWLLMAATRHELVRLGYLKPDSPGLSDYTDYLAIGTVADCVSIGSKNNRAIIRAGLRRMNDNARPVWQAFRETLKNPVGEVTAETISFNYAPCLNARTRLEDPYIALQFMLAKSMPDAKPIADLLRQENERRKEIEAKLLDSALYAAAEIVAAGRLSIVLYMPEGHPGVQGIVASRLVETFGRPTIVLSPKQGSDDEAVGSARGMAGFDVNQAIKNVANDYPGLLSRHGGHKAAGGVSLGISRTTEFADAFELATGRQITIDDVGPVVWTDGALEPSELTLETLQGLARLAPFGTGFEAPSFDGEFDVVDVRPLGNGTHLRVMLRAGAVVVQGVWFRAKRDASDPEPLTVKDHCRAVYSLSLNEYRGNRSLQMHIRHAARIAKPVRRRGYI